MAALLATGLLLAGCGGGGGTAGQAAAPAPERPGPEQAGPGQAGPGQAGPGRAGPARPAQGEGAGSANREAVARCTDADLSATVNEPTGTGQQRTILAWRNTSDRPCTMTGFGGVDLRGPDDPRFGPSYSLPRSSGQPTTITLRPGGTAITTITTLTGGDWTPTDVVATAPDGTSAKTVPWRGGPVQRQDGATRPGSFIGPVEQGSI